MKDSEVGEVWLWATTRGINDSDTYDIPSAPKGMIQNLIRKLVEERAWKLAYTYFKTALIDADNERACFKAALRDFGIDPKEFPAHVTQPEDSQDTLKSVSASEKTSEIKG